MNERQLIACAHRKAAVPLSTIRSLSCERPSESNFAPFQGDVRTAKSPDEACDDKAGIGYISMMTGASLACASCPVRDRAACAALDEREREDLASTLR